VEREAYGRLFGSNFHKNKTSDSGQKAGGGESAVDSVMIHTCLLWSEAALIFSEHLA